jgi:hypothetical protein
MSTSTTISTTIPSISTCLINNTLTNTLTHVSEFAVNNKVAMICKFCAEAPRLQAPPPHCDNASACGCVLCGQLHAQVIPM